MELTRRSFVKATTASLAAGSLAGLMTSSKEAKAVELGGLPEYRLTDSTETTTVCPFCAVGCGAVCYTKDGELINLEGDPDNPFNQGGMCAKGISQFGLRRTVDRQSGKVIDNPARVQKVLYRAPGGTEWEEKDWDFAYQRIAEKMVETREKDFIKTNEAGEVVNRLETISWLGSAALDNEELALSVKLARSFGLVQVEHQARI